MDLLNTIINFYENTSSNNKENYANSFKLPIEYLDNSCIYNINSNILNDLELIKNKNNDISNESQSEFNNLIDNSSNTNQIDNEYNNMYNLYYHVFDPKNIFEINIIDKWSKYYTNNKEFLLETQELLKNYKQIKHVEFEENNSTNLDNKYDKFYHDCESIIYDNGFINNYQYIDIPLFSNFNFNSIFLQCLSVYNLSSPLFSLLIPIIFLLLPFFIIKLQGHNVTFNLYFDHLKKVFSNHIIGQLFTSFNGSNITNKIYLIFSFGFYIFQMYLNFTSCIKYFTNIKYIHERLFDLKDYILNTLNKYENFLKYSKNLISYKLFNSEISNNITIFKNYYNELLKISPYKLSVNKLIELGQLMKCFYYLNKNDNFINSLYFSFGFNGYLKNIETLQKYLCANKINFCNYNNKKPTSFKDAYFANLNKINIKNKLLPNNSENNNSENNNSENNNSENNSKIVKNTYKFDKNLIITGPNASGKTTLLKSTLFNIILCQQIGCGFFSEASVKIYDYIHCYINIPDTGGRDSLYQAEARQCKNILENIENNSKLNHFCVFDELYSGTNPDEAITSAYGYLNYLNKFKNLDYILTTHYTKLCKKLDKENNNFCMKIINTEDDFQYTYKIKKGISKVKGALKVLKDLNYPENIIENMNN